ncbi:hypothetical protein AS589_02025 [Empedobacter brevis]|uniref:hypothetical protein n=1 Tax=Empedobacter brevis TaxID=247 RepID=UPI0013201F89|nr:hypothetical protein [Empedobacter brevis]QHC83650.1 hypothetical protein AS589_02025 [Empedobacter brevis]
MKKFFAVVAVAALSLGAVSCGEKKAEEAVENTTDSLVEKTDSLVEKTDSLVEKTDSLVEKTDSLKAETPAATTPATEAPAK